MNSRTIPFSPPPGRSLRRELADGTAGVGVKIGATLAAGTFLGGAGLILAFAVASVSPVWNRSSTGAYVYPRDELVAGMLVVGGVLFLLATGWVWSRKTRHRGLWVPAVITAAIAAGAVVLGAMLDASLHGATELPIIGVALLGASAAVLVWVQALRTHRAGRPPVNAQDGLLDVRCPACGYRMVGLRESRCPECGTAYTLDELLSRQQFHPPEPDGAERTA